MKRALIFAAAAALALPGLAAAQTVDTATGRLDVVGTAPSACLVSAPTAAIGGNATFSPTGAQSGEVRITQLVDENTAQPRETTINLALPIICNTAHHLIVRTSNGGLLRVGGSAGSGVVNGFREFLPYDVTAVWGGQTVTGASQNQTPVNITSNDGAAGQLSLTIAVPGGGAPLVAGLYGDAVVIELQVAS